MEKRIVQKELQRPDETASKLSIYEMTKSDEKQGASIPCPDADENAPRGARGVEHSKAVRSP